MLYPALPLGQDDPPHAVARMIGLVEEVTRSHGVPDPLQMSVAASDGVRLWGLTSMSRPTGGGVQGPAPLG